MDPNAANTPTPVSTPMSAAPAVTSPAQTGQLTGWSWGGFILGPTYIIALKKYIYLLLYLLFLVPIVNMVAILVIGIVLGIKGRQMAYESKTFANEAEATGFIKAADFAGKVMFIISVAFVVGFGALFLIIFSAFPHTITHPASFPPVPNTQYR